MRKVRTIDVHAHVLSLETIEMLQREAPKIAPRLTAADSDFSVLEVAGTPYRPFPRGAWDLERRFKDMDAAGIDVQVLSVTPQTFFYGQDPQIAAACAQIQNDQIARLVADHPDRFMGIATVPMQAPELAADELRRAVGSLGLRGALIGSNIDGKNLDDPALEPFWRAATDIDAFILIHPIKVAGADRMHSYYLVNLVGNPLDTTIAAASLVFGGVLERHPALRFCLAHGGGFVPYQAGRWAHGWKVRNEPKANLPHSPEEALNRFCFDTILHSKSSLEFLIHSVGASRVLLGSDYPFDMGTLDCVRQVRALAIPRADQDAILGGGAMSGIVPNTMKA